MPVDQDWCQPLRGLTHPHKQEWQHRQHVAQVAVETGLRTRQCEHDDSRSQYHEIVSPAPEPPRKESPRGEQGGEDENRQSPDWRFDSQCVQIVVPPAPHFLLAVQVRPLSLLKVVTLLVDTEEKIRRDRHWHRTQPCSTELISRDLVRVPASQRAAD